MVPLCAQRQYGEFECEEPFNFPSSAPVSLRFPILILNREYGTVFHRITESL